MVTEIMHNNYSNRDVYCRRIHQVEDIKKLDCPKCRYFSGYLLGKGVQCYWEDYSPVEELERNIPYEDRNKELLRVSHLIDLKVISKSA